MKQFTDWLAYVAVRLFICFVQTVTLDTCRTVARVLARLATDVFRLRHSVVDENIRHAFPELNEKQRREFTLGMWEHLLLMVCEIAHAPRKIHDTNWRNHFTVEGKADIVRLLLDTRPTVLVSGHYGNFEITSYMTGLFGFPTYAIARKLDNPYLDRYVQRFREANGQFILPKEGSAGRIQAVLDDGGIIALLGDQSAGPRGCWVDFMGRPASCHKAVALFTLVSGAPLIVAYGIRAGRPLQFQLGVAGIADPAQPGEEQAGVKTLTQWYNDRLEESIRIAPEQYWWVHRRWKGEPRQGRKQQETAAKAA